MDTTDERGHEPEVTVTMPADVARAAAEELRNVAGEFEELIAGGNYTPEHRRWAREHVAMLTAAAATLQTAGHAALLEVSR